MSASRKMVRRGMVFVLCLTAVSMSRTAPSQEGYFGRCCFNRRIGLACSPTCPGRRCGCGTCGSCTSNGKDILGPGPAVAEDVAPDAGGVPAAEPAVEGVAASFGAGYEAGGVQPYMIGDFFGGGATAFFPWINTERPVTATLPLAAGDRRFKVSENNSPLPANRVFMNYQHFANALDAGMGGQMALDRYVFGIEKTLLNGLWSVELRIPFAAGLDSTQAVGDPEFRSATEFGNVVFVAKRLLWRGEAWSAGAGMAMTIPTAADAALHSPDGGILVENEAVHLVPFLGLQITPNDRFWMLAYVQADFDANGNSVTFTAPGPQGPPVGQGVLQDQSLLHLDASWGYWVYRDTSGGGLLTGVAPILELHYSTTLQPGDRVVNGAVGNAVGAFTFDQRTLQYGDQRLDTLNLTGAVRFLLGQRSSLTVAGVAPLRTGDDQPFDGEVNVQYMWTF